MFNISSKVILFTSQSTNMDSCSFRNNPKVCILKYTTIPSLSRIREIKPLYNGYVVVKYIRNMYRVNTDPIASRHQPFIFQIYYILTQVLSSKM